MPISLAGCNGFRMPTPVGSTVVIVFGGISLEDDTGQFLSRMETGLATLREFIREKERAVIIRAVRSSEITPKEEPPKSLRKACGTTVGLIRIASNAARRLEAEFSCLGDHA